MTLMVQANVLPVLQTRRNSPTTLDLLKLTKHPFFLVFDYGCFMKGSYNNYLLGGSPYLGMCTSVTDDFVMYNSQELPVALSDSRKALRGHLRGEAYLVSLPTLMKMDHVYYNYCKFQRRSIMVELGDQKGRAPSPFITKAFAYIGVDHVWRELGLPTCRFFYENNKKVYEWA